MRMCARVRIYVFVRVYINVSVCMHVCRGLRVTGFARMHLCTCKRVSL